MVRNLFCLLISPESLCEHVYYYRVQTLSTNKWHCVVPQECRHLVKPVNYISRWKFERPFKTDAEKAGDVNQLPAFGGRRAVAGYASC